MPKLHTSRWRDPLLGYLLIGGAIFVAEARFSPDADDVVGIEIPDGVGDSWAREEALYREAIRLELDRGDVIVRRRMIQKMEFLLEGAPAEPDAADLLAWLQTHPDDYRRPARVALTQILFSRDRRGDRSRADALAALADPDLAQGDPTPLPGSLPLQSQVGIARHFGADFAAAVMVLPEGEWSGPMASAYGHHLVRVTAREAARNNTMDEVRVRVRADWLESARRTHREARIAEILERYGAAP